MRQIICFVFLLITLYSLGQNYSYDYERVGYPSFDITSYDSITSVKFYKSERLSYFFPKIPRSKGSLLYQFHLNDNHKWSEIIQYEPYSSVIEAKYVFDYSNDTLEKVTMFNEYRNISHLWLYEKGKLIEETAYGNQKLTDKWRLTYINDTLIKNIAKYNKHDSVLYEIRYEYDSLLRLIEEREYKRNNLVSIIYKSYNTTGKLQKVKIYPLYIRFWSLGDQRWVVNKKITNENEVLDENDIPFNYIVYEYDSLDRVLKETILKKDTLIETFDVYSYNNNGNIEAIVSYNNHFKPIRKYNFEYDQFDKIIGFKVYVRILGDNLDLNYDRRIFYNNKGNIIRVETIDHNSRLAELYTYEYL